MKPLLEKAWVHTDEPIRLEVDRQRQAQSYIGFLNNTTGKVFLEALDWQNSEAIITALTKLQDHYPGKKITVVWDNARWHKSQQLKAHLGDNNLLENIHLIWLPLYAPDHNPIEKVWSQAKQHISNHQHHTFNQTTTTFETYITTTTFTHTI